MVEQALGAVAGRGRLACAGLLAAADQHHAAVVAGGVEQALGLLAAVGHGGPQPRAQRGGEGGLVARLDLEEIGERRGGRPRRTDALRRNWLTAASSAPARAADARASSAARSAAPRARRASSADASAASSACAERG